MDEEDNNINDNTNNDVDVIDMFASLYPSPIQSSSHVFNTPNMFAFDNSSVSYFSLIEPYSTTAMPFISGINCQTIKIYENSTVFNDVSTSFKVRNTSGLVFYNSKWKRYDRQVEYNRINNYVSIDGIRNIIDGTKKVSVIITEDISNIRFYGIEFYVCELTDSVVHLINEGYVRSLPFYGNTIINNMVYGNLDNNYNDTIDDYNNDININNVTYANDDNYELMYEIGHNGGFDSEGDEITPLSNTIISSNERVPNYGGLSRRGYIYGDNLMTGRLTQPILNIVRQNAQLLQRQSRDHDEYLEEYTYVPNNSNNNYNDSDNESIPEDMPELEYITTNTNDNTDNTNDDYFEI